MPTACYIHIPFCSGKCKYCNFVSFNKPELINAYIDKLLMEIESKYAGELLQTLYFGGGTPSVIQPSLIKKVKNIFKISDNAEITLELNPENGDYNYLKELRKIGVNRLSIGCQTFNDNLLKSIGRRHDSKDIFKTVKNAKSAGFENISVDLIYGLPHQTVKDIQHDLAEFTKLDIHHISTYGLKIEPDSYWGKNTPDNVPDDDYQADMYESINCMLLKSGFERYEISNFAKNGYEARHNLTYWNNLEYYGFGVAAHGYVNGIRYSNYRTLEEYLANNNFKEYTKNLTPQEKLEEEIFLGFRKTAGIDIRKINSLYRIDFDKKYKKILEKYSDYIIKTTSGYALNLKGVMLSNEILANFIDE